MVDTLPEAISNFSLMHRGNPCECGSAPCTSVVPRRTGSVSNLAKTPVRTTSSAPVRRTLRGDSAVKARCDLYEKDLIFSGDNTRRHSDDFDTEEWLEAARVWQRHDTRSEPCCPGCSGAGAPDTTSSSGTRPTSRNRSTSTSTAMRPTSRKKNVTSTRPSRGHLSPGVFLRYERSGEPAQCRNWGRTATLHFGNEPEQGFSHTTDLYQVAIPTAGPLNTREDAPPVNDPRIAAMPLSTFIRSRNLAAGPRRICSRTGLPRHRSACGTTRMKDARAPCGITARSRNTPEKLSGAKRSKPRYLIPPLRLGP